MRKMKLMLVLVLLALFAAAVVVGQRLRSRSIFRAPVDSKLLEVKKGEPVDRRAWEWNQKQKANACVAEEDKLGARKGDHVVCSGATSIGSQPHYIPDGYCVIYYTSGCPTCAVGWVYGRGSRCENCLNCAN